MSLKLPLAAAILALAAQAQAQSTLPSGGALVIVPAFGEVTHANDLAFASFSIEEQDRDKAACASRVNQKMKQGTEIIRAQDPQATFKTQGYYTYPVYPDERPQPNGLPQTRPRVPTAWRVGQVLEVTTTNLAGLPKTAASAQKVLALSGVRFGLTPATIRKLDDERIAATYRNLNERIASIAAAMGRQVSDTVLETVDFEGSGRYAGQDNAPQAAMMLSARGKFDSNAEVAEPSFEPGETTLQMHLVGKVKFK